MTTVLATYSRKRTTAERPTTSSWTTLLAKDDTQIFMKQDKPLQPDNVPPCTPRPRPRRSMEGNSQTTLPDYYKGLHTSRSIPHTTRENRRRTRQLYVDLGQRSFGWTTCRTCGMLYFRGEEEDEQLHTQFHAKTLALVDCPGWKRERVVRLGLPEGARVILVLASDPLPHHRKIADVQRVIDRELGSSYPDSKGTKEECKTFLYISSRRKVIGCVTAEPISSAFRVVATTDNESSDAVECRVTPSPASLGFARVWVASTVRCQGIATTLLDTARTHFFPGQVIDKSRCAFCQPTHDGRRLATKYFGTSTFLAYSST